MSTPIKRDRNEVPQFEGISKEDPLTKKLKESNYVCLKGGQRIGAQRCNRGSTK